MMELADGTKVARGDKDWQYWKFAWRHLGPMSAEGSQFEESYVVLCICEQ